MDDYISRKAALEEIEEWADTFSECDYVFPHILKSLKKLPAADVRTVVHGEWGKSLNPSFSPFDDSGEYRYQCNQCRHIQSYESNFCPNCGADMREVKDE